MSKYSQSERPIKITTPLGEDVLLLTRIHGHEGISQLFDFQLELLAERDSADKVKFDALVGQAVTIELTLFNDDIRYFNGIIRRFSQGGRDETFIRYRAAVVPKLWLLTKAVRSRIFQHLSIPDILQQVFTGLDVSYEISGSYFPRDYCVQYRESDFAFASRLMEEEGIYYFFKHGNGSHQMIVTDIPLQHPELAGQSEVIFDELEGLRRDDMRISAWEKTQELRSGKYTLWDHSFELPGNHLEAKETTVSSVAVGEVTHKLNVGGNDGLEIYDFPGGYAQRFDGIDRTGGPQPSELQKIFQDNARTTRIRMEQEEAITLAIEGASNCGQFLPGYKFTLQRHFDADDEYLLTGVDHDARQSGYRTDVAEEFTYENTFRCIPVSLPYRPQRVTPRPSIPGAQTATVVGPSGQEIFCDKYGRVKVQFHWDREGKNNGDSSCWLRVAQVWAGKGWGAFFWPRIGHEVVVIFEEGDPDQPIIVGSVYNAENMPPFVLPKANMLAGWKSSSVTGDPGKNFNAIFFVDEKGKEHVVVHSERHMILNAEFDKKFRTGRHEAERVPLGRSTTVGTLIGGGGSGGGPSDFWPTDPQGIMGFNSVMVYGTNFQIACPVNVQLAVGSNLQICVNPASFWTIFADNVPPPGPGLTQLMGSGFGGNMQLTLGSSANVVMGQPITVNLGPRAIDIEAHSNTQISPATLHMGIAIYLAVIIFTLAYAIPDDDARFFTLLTFQTLLQFLLLGMMNFHDLYNDTDTAQKELYKAMFVATTDDKTKTETPIVLLDTANAALADVAALGGFVPIFFGPFVLGSLAEKHVQVGQN